MQSVLLTPLTVALRSIHRNLKCLLLCGAVFAAYSSTADAQITYISPVTGSGLTVGTFLGGTTFNGTPVIAGTPTNGTSTTAGSFTAAYSNGTGQYSGSGSSQLTYALNPSGLAVSSVLSGTADSLAYDGNPNDYVVTVASGGVTTDFTVATTGSYELKGSESFGGTSSAEFGALFLNLSLNDHNGPLFIDDNLQDDSVSPDTQGSIDDVITLVAGDLYTLQYGLSVNPATAASVSPFTSTLSGTAQASLTELPEPASLSLLGLTAISLALRPKRRLRAV